MVHILVICRNLWQMNVLKFDKYILTDASMKKKKYIYSFIPHQNTLKYGSKNRPYLEGLNVQMKAELYDENTLSMLHSVYVHFTINMP